MKKIISCVIIIIAILTTFSTYSYGGIWDNITNIPGSIGVWLCDALLIVPDLFQMGANAFETSSLGTSYDRRVCYEYQYLEDDGVEGNSKHTDSGAGHRNMFTMVKTGYVKDDKSAGQTEEAINIDIEEDNSTTESKYDFSSSTLIPVIIVDWYKIAAGNIEAFDADFLSLDSNSGTKYHFVRMIIRIEIYFASVMLILGLLWHAINLSTRAINPNERKGHIEGLQNFAQATAFLVLTIIIMALGIYLNKLTFSFVSQSNEVELPIRVNVKEASYSFSTTQTGYNRYMASMQNPDLLIKKVSYAKDYLIDAVCNFALAIICFARKFIIIIVAAIGPMIVICKIIGKEGLIPLDFTHWAIWYMILALMQSLISLGYIVIAN